MNKSILFVFILVLLMMSKVTFSRQSIPDKPLRVGIAGLTHTHVHWILGREKKGDVEIVGISEANRDLSKRYSDQHGYSMDIVFDDLESMIENVKPEAVLAFNSIYGHLKVVQICAPKGIHVMVEKPLAVSLDHALEMHRLAKKHGIQLLTNYETTWYATNHKAFDMVSNGDVGEIRKVVIRDGHKGPKEIGVNEEFLDWLTDPVLNGGGAVIDFGCYGANLMTWLMKGQKPESVYALTKTIKPDVYPKVDDEATIILSYPKAQAIIEASWNWPFPRKDMDIYGKTGYIISEDRSKMRFKLSETDDEKKIKLAERDYPYDDPFGYMAAILRGAINPPINDLSSLENNMIVMEILDAAVRSARSGKAIPIE